MAKAKCPVSNDPLQDLLATTQDMILIILFCSLKTLHVLIEIPPKMIPYLITEWKSAKYTIHKVTKFRTGNNFLITKQPAVSFGGIW
jgi:hypothetical protein